MAWTFAGTTVAKKDEPLYTSDYPEAQEDMHVEHQPVGLASANSTILTFVGAPSKRARLDFICSATMRDLLISLKRTTFTIVDVWGASGSWYLARLTIRHLPWSQTTAAHFNVSAFLVGR